MPFVQRNAGVIVGLFANRQVGIADEEIADNHPDVIAFLVSTQLSVPSAADLTRAASFRLEADRIDLMTRLKTATPAQIDTWVDANVTTLAQARTVLKAVIKVIALDTRS